MQFRVLLLFTIFYLNQINAATVLNGNIVDDFEAVHNLGAHTITFENHDDVTGAANTFLIDSSKGPLKFPEFSGIPTETETKQRQSLDSIGYFGLGLYSAGVFDRYNRLRSEVQEAQEHAMATSMEMRRQFVSLVISLSNTVRANRNSLQAVLENMVVTAEKVKPISTTDSMPCYEAFENSKAQIVSKINELNIDIYHIGLDVNELCVKYITYYNDIISNCKTEYPDTIKQINQLEVCVKDTKRTADLEVVSLKYLIHQKGLDLSNNITSLIQTTNRQVNNMIQTTQETFTKCIG